MKRELITSADGSHTFYLPAIDEHYHSVHGAIQESKHVFIKAGYSYIQKQNINILEIGFGTGLNALLTLMETDISNQKVNYTALEKYPLCAEEYRALNYNHQLGFDCTPTFYDMHSSPSGQWIKLTANFRLMKREADALTFDYSELEKIDLVYFDAFAPNKQADLWSGELFKAIYDSCNTEAVFVTYSARGEVRRNLQSAGFKVERLPGPPGKREMLRAIK